MSLKRLKPYDYHKFVGQKFGELTIESFEFGDGKTRVNCLCSCGVRKSFIFNNLRNKTTSCGCVRSRLLSSKRIWTEEQKIENKKAREKVKKRWLTEQYKESKAKWIERNKETLKKKKLEAHYKKLSDPLYVLKRSIRNRFKAAIKGGYKSGSAIKNLGCSIEELKDYLESKFLPNMSWSNYGQYGWHIDHIIPLSKFNLTDPEQLKQACHYTNLQPMWWRDNLVKGNK